MTCYRNTIINNLSAHGIRKQYQNPIVFHLGNRTRKQIHVLGRRRDLLNFTHLDQWRVIGHLFLYLLN